MIPERFEQQLARHGVRPALRIDGATVCYQEPNRAADRVVHALVRHIARQQVPIAAEGTREDEFI